MTNGEKMQEIFPEGKTRRCRDGVVFESDGWCHAYDSDWWNAEYKEPTTKHDLGVDAVSRQEVLYLIADDDLSMGQVVKGIHALPSITLQEPKMGKWINTETKGVRYAFWCRYKCSLCGGLSDHTNFCPNCGAKMESEDKE